MSKQLKQHVLNRTREALDRLERQSIGMSVESGVLIGQISDPPIICSAERGRHGAHGGTGSMKIGDRCLRNV